MRQVVRQVRIVAVCVPLVWVLEVLPDLGNSTKSCIAADWAFADEALTRCMMLGNTRAFRLQPFLGLPSTRSSLMTQTVHDRHMVASKIRQETRASCQQRY